MRAPLHASGDARRFVVGASLAVAAVLVAIAVLIHSMRGLPVSAPFSLLDLDMRALLGLGAGGVAGLLCVVALRLRRLASVRRLARHAIEGLEPRWHTVATMSLAAGISEEYLFRGTLEPAVGIWISTLAFVTLHGALRIRGRDSLLFPLFLVGASLGLSALCARMGLEAAMAAHASYDAAVLAGLLADARRHPAPVDAAFPH